MLLLSLAVVFCWIKLLHCKLMVKIVKKVVVVLGMHRSGTSALAGVLRHAGVDFASEDMHFGVDVDVNAKGYWEHAGIVKLNDRLLTSLGSSWDDFRPVDCDSLSQEDKRQARDEIKSILEADFSGSPLIGIKDPRICKLLPVWLDLFDELGVRPYFVVITRHPYEVERSLHTRDQMVAEKARLLWLSYSLQAEEDTRGMSRSFITYEDLLNDWAAVFARIQAELGIQFNLSGEAVDRISGFLTGGLRHAVYDAGATANNQTWEQRVFSDLLRLENDPMDASALRSLDDLRQRFLDSLDYFAPLIFGEESSGGEILKIRKQYSDLLQSYDQAQDAYNQANDAYNQVAGSYAELREAYDHLEQAYNGVISEREEIKAAGIRGMFWRMKK